MRKAAEDNRGLCAGLRSLAQAPRAPLQRVRRRRADDVPEKRGRFRAQADERLSCRRPPQLQSLEEQGLFVIHTPEGYRPLRALSRSRRYDRYGGEHAARNADAGAPLRLVPRRNRPPPDRWVRRRDRSDLQVHRAATQRTRLARELARSSGREPSGIWSRRACGRPARTSARRSRRSSASIRSSSISGRTTSCRSTSTT